MAHSAESPGIPFLSPHVCLSKGRPQGCTFQVGSSPTRACLTDQFWPPDTEPATKSPLRGWPALLPPPDQFWPDGEYPKPIVEFSRWVWFLGYTHAAFTTQNTKIHTHSNAYACTLMCLLRLYPLLISPGTDTLTRVRPKRLLSAPCRTQHRNSRIMPSPDFPRTHPPQITPRPSLPKIAPTPENHTHNQTRLLKTPHSFWGSTMSYLPSSPSISSPSP